MARRGSAMAPCFSKKIHVLWCFPVRLRHYLVAAFVSDFEELDLRYPWAFYDFFCNTYIAILQFTAFGVLVLVPQSTVRSPASVQRTLHQ